MSRTSVGERTGVHKKILITAGPTYEAIDPVRFIGNHSSGRMGYAIADAFARTGAEVYLVSGPTSIHPEQSDIKIISVVSASDMYRECAKLIEEMDIALFAAAVADFSPEKSLDSKIKSEKDELVLKLIPTKDIAAGLGKTKRKDQLFVGFALETEHGIENAKRKLIRKNLDLIVMNTLEDEGAGFGTETNKVTMIDKSGNIDKFDLKLKSEVALDIVEKTLKLLKNA